MRLNLGVAIAAPFFLPRYALAKSINDDHDQGMTAPSATLNVLSCNIQAGASTGAYRHYLTRSWSHVLPAGKQVNLADLAAIAQPFDVVGLQESDPGSLRSGFNNQAQLLAERARFPYWSHQGNRKVANIAHSGNALLSRLEPQATFDYALPGRRGGRGVLLAQFGQAEQSWQLAVTHLSLSAASRRMQLDFLAELLSEHKRCVLMGDFNCSQHAPEMQNLFRKTQLKPPPETIATFPSWSPKRAIDHVFCAGFSVENYRSLPAAGSDHLGVAVALRMTE